MGRDERDMIFLYTNIISYYFNADNTIKEKMLEAIDNDEEICTENARREFGAKPQTP
jgi:hypothetical protein